MDKERSRRKWAYSLVVILLEWGFLSSVVLAYAYEIFHPNGILLIVGAVGDVISQRIIRFVYFA